MYLDLRVWLKDRFGITAYNFIFEKIMYNNPQNRYRLYILLSSAADYHSMLKGNFEGYDPKKQEETAEKFYELAIKHSFEGKEKIKDAWICYNDFSEEMKTDTNSRAYKNVSDFIKKKYGENALWNFYTAFSSVVVFFYNDEDILKNRENGVCEMIKEDYFKALKGFDEFDVYNQDNFRMNFDSKENLDKNYEGNLYYYFK